MPFAGTRGFRVHYQDGGEGPPLVLLNGWMVSSYFWPRPWLDRLERSFRVLRVDHRGTGHSELPDGPFTLDDMAADALGVLDELGLERAHFMGVSMGGIITQQIALTRPERVLALVFCSTTPGGGHAETDPDFAAALAEGAGSRDTMMRSVLPLVAAPGFFEGSPDSLMELAVAWQAAPTSFEVMGQQLGACAAADFLGRLREIEAPTLVLHGDQDRLLPVDNGRLIAGAIPGARLEVLPGTGHMLTWEAPETAELVASFLESVGVPG